MKTGFTEAVNSHELAKVRMMLCNELLLDPRGNTFSEMLAYAKDNLHDLFEENKESNYEIPIDKSQWDSVLLSKVKRDLNSNFSVEKLAFFQEIAMWVGREKANNLEEEANRNSKKDEDSFGNISGYDSTTYQRNRRMSRAIGTISTIGGASLTVYAIGAGKVMLGILGGGAIIVGGIILCTTKKNN